MQDCSSRDASRSCIARRRAQAWCIAVAAALLAGCGQSSIERVGVSGTVRLDDQPLKRGSILFVPLPPAKGPKAGGPIVDGSYELARSEGPVIGPHRVEISADLDLPAAPDDPLAFDAATGGRLPPNSVPEAYNTRSELVAETKSGEPNRFDFDLRSTASATR